jgi:hypothetical protein
MRDETGGKASVVVVVVVRGYMCVEMPKWSASALSILSTEFCLSQIQ